MTTIETETQAADAALAAMIEKTNAGLAFWMRDIIEGPSKRAFLQTYLDTILDLQRLRDALKKCEKSWKFWDGSACSSKHFFHLHKAKEATTLALTASNASILMMKGNL